MGKIFCIGLNKTGTQSLAAALRMLGFRVAHMGGAAGNRKLVRAMDEGLPLLSYFGVRYDAYLDLPVLQSHFDLADRQYPGSKFILTTRNLDSWLHSRERHVRGNVEARSRGDYDGGFLVIDRDRWIRRWHEHHTRVNSYFENRPGDLLAIDITAGQGWELLAPFVGCDVPAVPFPWRNQLGSGSYRARGALELRTRASYLIARIRRQLRTRLSYSTQGRPSD